MSDRHRCGDHGGAEDVGRLVGEAYACSVDVDTAARHLWRLHQEAGRRRVQRVRRTLTSALAAVFLFAGTGAAVAVSGQALPGDALYPVKRSAERVHLLVSFAPESDARLHLKFARARLLEAQHVAAARPDAVPALLGEVVHAVQRAERVGGDRVVDDVDVVRAEASAAASALGPGLDVDAAAELARIAGELAPPAVAETGGDDGGPVGVEPPGQPDRAGEQRAPASDPPRERRPRAGDDPAVDEEALADESDATEPEAPLPSGEPQPREGVSTEPEAPAAPVADSPSTPTASPSSGAKARPDLERLEGFLADD